MVLTTAFKQSLDMLQREHVGSIVKPKYDFKGARGKDEELLEGATGCSSAQQVKSKFNFISFSM